MVRSVAHNDCPAAKEENAGPKRAAESGIEPTVIRPYGRMVPKLALRLTLLLCGPYSPAESGLPAGLSFGQPEFQRWDPI
jgi:hypothetical protein